MEFYFSNSVQLSCDFGKVVLSGTTQGKVCQVVTKSKNMFILNIKLNNIFIFNIFDDYFPFMLQRTKTIQFTMFGPLH